MGEWELGYCKVKFVLNNHTEILVVLTVMKRAVNFAELQIWTLDTRCGIARKAFALWELQFLLQT